MISVFPEMGFFEILSLLIFAHCLADYPLQGDFLAQGKSRHTPVGKVFWPHCLSAHSIIHGGMVGILTGSVVLFWLEAAIHAITDWMKCEGKISMRADQTIHYCCKIAWAGIYSAFLV